MNRSASQSEFYKRENKVKVKNMKVKKKKEKGLVLITKA